MARSTMQEFIRGHRRVTIARATLDTNHYGVENVTIKLLPLLRPGGCILNHYGVEYVTIKLLPLVRPGGCILNVSSSVGQLQNLGDSKIAKILADENNLSEDFVDSYAAKYLEDVKKGRRKEGWGTAHPDYSNTKVLLNASTRAFTKTLLKNPKDRKIYVNALCPGFVATDLNGHRGILSTEAGADTPVWLALLLEEGYPHGGLPS